MEMQLETPLDLRVGGNGIIGRRITLKENEVPGKEQSLGDGIVGYNC